LKVLLAEDNSFNQKLATEMLQMRGHSVTVAQSGVEVLSKWASDKFDLVLMDVQMPEMDGLEATRRIRQQEKTAGRHIPIIAMTAHAMTGDRDRCLEAGMDDYVSKPIRSSKLFSAVERAIARASPRSDDHGAGDTAVSPGDCHPSSSMDREEESTVDWEEALRNFEGSDRLLLLATEGFLEENPKMIASVRGPVEATDAATLRITAHALKGALRYFGPSAAVDCALRLERMGESGSVVGAADVLNTLEEEIRRMIPSFERYVREARRRKPEQPIDSPVQLV
jgi:CheY-like chemotaxis protein/HPt (histidine-containing phosphotransfer) domain-containing protein